MCKWKIFKEFSFNNDDVEAKEVSIDAYYKEKYTEMRRHRDFQLSTANWCTVILLAIIAGFVTLNEDAPPLAQFGCYGYILFKSSIILFIWTIIFLGSRIVIHSADRYQHLRDWVSIYLEPTIKGQKYTPKPPEVPLQNVIIGVLVFLGFLSTVIVLVLYNPSNILSCFC